MKLVHGSTFSGIGGPEVAAEMLGWENAFHCEINPFGRQLLDYYFPNAESYGDITKTDFSKWRGRIDVLTGGFPCQPFSYAGKRGGANDDRYLWPFMLKCIDQIRPTWFVGENVAGIATMVLPSTAVEMGSSPTLFDEGDHYTRTEQRYVIEEICRNLEGIGYSVQPLLIPACAVGAPHRRDRIFFVAHNERDAAANAHGCDDRPKPRNDGSQTGTQRVQERHNVREFGGTSSVRSEGCGTVANADSGRPTTPKQPSGQQRQKMDSRSENEPFNGACGYGAERFAANADLQRCNEPNAAGEPSRTQRFDCKANIDGRNCDRESGCYGLPWCERARMDERARGAAADTDNNGLQRGIQPERDGQRWWNRKGWAASVSPNGIGMLHSSQRWRTFPIESPICRGNDGLPFPLDSLAIPKGKYFTESLRAYGNAIVPQVIYTIFEAIQATYENDRAS